MMRRTIYEDSRIRAELILPEEAPHVLILFPGMDEEPEAFSLPGCEKAALCGVSGFDWNADLSPWPAPPAFRNGESFAGKAPAFLRLLTEKVLPEAVRHVPNVPVGIAGYSLAGLFALWAAGQDARFTRAASMSGSLWYPGAAELITQTLKEKKPGRIYLSLGTKEERARNPVLDGNGAVTRRMADELNAAGIRTVFVSTPGTHFDQVPERIARGISFLTEDF